MPTMKVDFGVHGLAGLTDLVVGGQPAGVDGGTGAAHNAAQLGSQLFSQLDAALDVLQIKTNKNTLYCTALCKIKTFSVASL